MRSRLGLLVFILIAALALAAGRPRQFIPGVYTVDVGPCSLDLHRPPVQPVATLALACPGVDYIRLWPLPVVKPWAEDGEDGPPIRRPIAHRASRKMAPAVGRQPSCSTRSSSFGFSFSWRMSRTRRATSTITSAAATTRASQGSSETGSILYISVSSSRQEMSQDGTSQMSREDYSAQRRLPFG
jgi:hypothetical protein